MKVVDKVSDMAHQAVDLATDKSFEVADKIVDKGDELNNLAHVAVDKATNKTYQVAEKIADQGDELNNLGHETINKFTSATNKIAENITEQSDKLVNTQQILINHSCKYIRENPLYSLGIAFGAGYLLTKLLRNRWHIEVVSLDKEVHGSNEAYFPEALMNVVKDSLVIRLMKLVADVPAE